VDRIAWHERTRITGPDGQPVSPVLAPGDPFVAIPDADPAQAIARALSAGSAGVEFCLYSGPNPPSEPCPHPGHLQCQTSGSTGRPKRIRRSQASWLASFAENAGAFGFGAGDRYAVLGAASHSLILYAACEAATLGADLDILSGIRPDRQRGRLAARPPSVLYATPAQLRQIATLPGPAIAGDLRILVGGGAVDPRTAETVATLFPDARISQFYGASETSFIALAGPETPAGSVGTAYPGVEIALRDEVGHAVLVGQAGEIWVRSPYLFAGYAEGQSADTRWRDGWLTVGELGRMDQNGNLFLSGRRSRMFTVADQNLFPEEIEDHLLTLPGIARAAVVRGHVPVAFVSGAVDVDAVLGRCRAELGPLRAPRAIRVLADWPVLGSGKTDLKALEALL
jgi:long-chain acyl-CoA synthetase